MCVYIYVCIYIYIYIIHIYIYRLSLWKCRKCDCIENRDVKILKMNLTGFVPHPKWSWVFLHMPSITNWALVILNLPKFRVCESYCAYFLDNGSLIVFASPILNRVLLCIFPVNGDGNFVRFKIEQGYQFREYFWLGEGGKALWVYSRVSPQW